jgi:hypothetical protein
MAAASLMVQLVSVLGKGAHRLLNAVVGDVERHRAACVMDCQWGVKVELVAHEPIVAADNGEPCCDSIELALFLVPLGSDKALLTVLAVLLGPKYDEQFAQATWINCE